jgi:hypothetical protein
MPARAVTTIQFVLASESTGVSWCYSLHQTGAHVHVSIHFKAENKHPCLQRLDDPEVSNPSDVTAHGMKLPLQRIVRPVRHELLQQARKEQPDAPERALLCGNALITLATPKDVPGEIVHWPDADFEP